jgi:pimeloyl-ACP methyl ester carboxylesterase
LPEIQLTAGPLEYEDTGGAGPVLLFLHGVLMDESVWRHVVDDLRADHRCVVPTLPLGSHRRPLRADADLSLRGHARIAAELIERLELGRVTAIQIDHGLAQVLAAERPHLVSRLVLGPQEAFENYPPGLPGKLIGVVGALPGGLYLAVQQLRLRWFRRTPLAFGWMSKRVPDEILDRWFRPAQTQRLVRRDLVKYIRSVKRRQLLAVAERLRSFDRPVLVVWSTDDRIMPPEHGARFAQLFQDARLVEVADSFTLIPEDQPQRFASAIRDFVGETGAADDVATEEARGR